MKKKIDRTEGRNKQFNNKVGDFNISFAITE